MRRQNVDGPIVRSVIIYDITVHDRIVVAEEKPQSIRLIPADGVEIDLHSRPTPRRAHRSRGDITGRPSTRSHRAAAAHVVTCFVFGPFPSERGRDRKSTRLNSS